MAATHGGRSSKRHRRASSVTGASTRSPFLGTNAAGVDEIISMQWMVCPCSGFPFFVFIFILFFYLLIC